MGFYYAFGQYYRFAAVEVADAAFRSRAISLFLIVSALGARFWIRKLRVGRADYTNLLLFSAPLPPLAFSRCSRFSS